MWTPEAIGTWVGAAGTFITGFALGFFACRQNKINKRVMETELAQRYSNHYVELVRSLRSFVTHPDLNNANNLHTTWPIMDLCNEAELIFHEDIIKINQTIFKKVKDITYQKRLLAMPELAPDQKQAAHDEFVKLWGSLTGDEMYAEIKNLYKKQTKILSYGL